MNCFTKENYSEYKDKLLNAFPPKLKSDVQVVLGVIPFAMNDIELCNGETRKFEILEVLDRHINEKNIDNYKRFVKDNPKYFLQTECRMISYWNAYYRRHRFPKLKDYIGYRLVNRIK